MSAPLYWTPECIAAMGDALLIEELLVALTLDVDARLLTEEVIRRGLVERASVRAFEQTTSERYRRGEI